MLVKMSVSANFTLLSVQDLSRLLALLSDDTASLENMSIQFSRTFAKNDQFRAGCTISLLLQDRLLTREQRIVGFYILCDLYRYELLS